MPPDTNLIDVINSKKSEHKDSRIGKFSVLPLYFRDMSIGMDTLEGDVLGICSRDLGLSGCNEEEISDVLCLLRSSSSGNAGVYSAVNRLDWRGMDHWRGIVWDLGIMDKRCLHACYDCLCLIAFVP